MQSSSEIELFYHAVHGNRQALSNLYIRYYSKLMHYGLRINPNKFFVEESIQEIFAYIVESGHRIGDVRNVKAYLFSSLRRKIIRSLEAERKLQRNRKEHFSILDIRFDQEDLSYLSNASSTSTEYIANLLNDLPWRQKEAIYLRYYNDLSTREIAQVMNIAEQTVLNTIYQALIKVKATRKRQNLS